jgi:Dam-replacing family/Dam-replacing HTH domain
MKLGFEETQSSYSSGSQSARAWTEAWVSAWAYCPHCGNAKISSFPNNSPLTDFFCTSCSEEFELKSQKGKFGAKVLDGEFKIKCERLAASNNPNLLLMNYDLKSLAVVNLFIVPKHFFVREIIEERKPLAVTARRAGWIGSRILLDRVPESGKIHIVQGGIVRAKELVLAEWQKTLFLRNESPETRGWLLDVMNCVESLGKRDFTLDEIYAFERISVISTRATRTSNPRYASSFNICATAGLSISSRVVTIDCDPRRLTWPGFSTSTNAPAASGDGAISGRACATMSARTVARGICRPSTART